MRTLKWAVPALAVLAATLSCGTPQDQAKKVVTRLVESIEKKDIQAFDECIAYDYNDVFDQGRAGVIGSFQDAFVTYRTIDLTVSNVTVTVSKNQTAAEARFDVHADLVRSEHVKKPLENVRYDLVVALRLVKHPDGWKVAFADGMEKVEALPTPPPETETKPEAPAAPMGAPEPVEPPAELPAEGAAPVQ